ncbi:MAG TPA: GntR family transcriptional regulator [Solirubrobacteraceae bacterium]|jgi:DNA-binding transcriptional regulator YhcF (GntR family)
MTPISEPSQALLQELVLDRNAEVPLGVQLAWALRARIGDGRFAPGQRLPGLRDLAEALHINANTVRTVYQRLEHEGVLLSRQGSGTFVADQPSQTPSAVDTIAANAAREAHDTGVDPRAVAAALYVAPAGAGQPLDAEAARRHELRTQIAALQRTLGELEARHPALVPQPAGAKSRAARPRLLDVRELERVQAQLISRLAALHAAIDGLGASPAVPPRGKPPRPKTKRKVRPAPAGA